MLAVLLRSHDDEILTKKMPNLFLGTFKDFLDLF